MISLPSSVAESLERNITPPEQELMYWLADQETEMINLLERRTNITSGSLNKAGMAELAENFSHELSTMGFDINTLTGGQIVVPRCPGSDYSIDLADLVLASKSGNGKRLLLLGHLDTVFPPDRLFQSYRRGGDRVPGPSVTAWRTA